MLCSSCFAKLQYKHTFHLRLFFLQTSRPTRSCTLHACSFLEILSLRGTSYKAALKAAEWSHTAGRNMWSWAEKERFLGWRWSPVNCEDRHSVEGIRWQRQKTANFPVHSSEGAAQVGHHAVRVTDSVERFRQSRRRSHERRTKRK